MLSLRTIGRFWNGRQQEMLLCHLKLLCHLNRHILPQNSTYITDISIPALCLLLLHPEFLPSGTLIALSSDPPFSSPRPPAPGSSHRRQSLCLRRFSAFCLLILLPFYTAERPDAGQNGRWPRG